MVILSRKSLLLAPRGRWRRTDWGGGRQVRQLLRRQQRPELSIFTRLERCEHNIRETVVCLVYLMSKEHSQKGGKS